MSELSEPVFILTRPQQEANIGAAARVLKNFEFDTLWLVSPDCSLGLEARRKAVMGADLLDRVRFFPDLKAALMEVDIGAAVTRRYDSGKAGWSTIGSFSRELSKLNGSRVGYVFGPEESGLSRSEVTLCHHSIEIPASDAHGSLNLSHAVAIVAYSLCNAAGDSRASPLIKDPASLDQRKALLSRASEVVRAVGPALSEDKVAMRLARIVARASLDQADFRLLMTLCRCVLDATNGTPAEGTGDGQDSAPIRRE